jgi:hypothetical protein
MSWFSRFIGIADRDSHVWKVNINSSKYSRLACQAYLQRLAKPSVYQANELLGRGDVFFDDLLSLAAEQPPVFLGQVPGCRWRQGRNPVTCHQSWSADCSSLQATVSRVFFQWRAAQGQE